MVLIDQKGPSSEELLSRIAKHDRYFARMINLIPRDLYLHTHSSSFSAEVPSSSVAEAVAPAGSSDPKKRKAQETVEENHAVNERYYKHRKQPLTADERKLRSQQNKKSKYSTENAKVDAGGEDDEENESDAASSEEEEDDADDGEDEDDEEEEEHEKQEKAVRNRKETEASSRGAKASRPSSHTQQASPAASPSPATATPGPSHVKIDELRRRLQERIASLKSQRLPTKKRPAERPPSKTPPLKKPAAVHRGSSEESIEELKAQLAFQRDLPAPTASSSSSSPSLSADLTSTADLEFGHVVSEERELRTAPIKRDGGKVQRIKKLLHEAEIKRERLRTLMASKDEVEVRKAKAEQWQDVLKTAAGEKTLAVDPTASGLSKAELKLKKALKRREKKKQRSAEEWTARLDKVQEEKTARQNKKEENRKNRKAQRYGGAEAVSVPVEKDARKKAVPIGRPGGGAGGGGAGGAGGGKAKDAKGEQKGRNRAGFEGKKVAFLNGSKN